MVIGLKKVPIRFRQVKVRGIKKTKKTAMVVKKHNFFLLVRQPFGNVTENEGGRGLGTRDSGLGTRDSGLGTRDSGLENGEWRMENGGPCLGGGHLVGRWFIQQFTIRRS